MSKTLSDFLSANGLKTAAAKPTTPAAKTTVKAAATKRAEDQSATAGSAAQATTEPADGHKLPDKSTEAPAQDTGKTAAQQWLAARGINVAHPQVAEAMIAGVAKTAEATKFAHLEKRAEEERLRGELFYEGMVRKSCAYKLASGEMSIEEAAAVAPTCGTNIHALVKHAEQLQAAMGSPALVGGLLGSAAKVDASAVTQVADKNDNTSTTRDIEAIEGTRKGTSGIDEKVLRFVDVWTLPGNPGLNHGQAVDQGKGN
jgi:hypothetical protein